LNPILLAKRATKMPRTKKQKSDDDLPELIDPRLTPKNPDILIISEVIPMRDLQDMYINWVMTQCDNDKDLVAKRLEISKKTIYNRCKHGNVQNIK
jgi:transcriptional regulator with PAS, ATPase and Fis domain